MFVFPWSSAEIYSYGLRPRCVKLISLFSKEDLTKFVTQTLRLVFARIIHRNHIGSYFLRTLNRWKHAWSQNKLAILRDQLLTVGRRRELDIKPPGIGARCLVAQRQVIRIGEIFIEGNVGNRSFVLFDEFDVGDADLRFAFNDRWRYWREGFDQQRLLLGQRSHVFAPFGPHELLQVPKKFRRGRVSGRIRNADFSLPFGIQEILETLRHFSGLDQLGVIENTDG